MPHYHEALTLLHCSWQQTNGHESKIENENQIKITLLNISKFVTRAANDLNDFDRKNIWHNIRDICILTPSIEINNRRYEERLM